MNTTISYSLLQLLAINYYNLIPPSRNFQKKFRATNLKNVIYTNFTLLIISKKIKLFNDLFNKYFGIQCISFA